MPARSSTTKLPAALRDELGLPTPSNTASGSHKGGSSFRGGGGGHHARAGNGRGRGGVRGRRDARKAERQDKKQSRTQQAQSQQSRPTAGAQLGRTNGNSHSQTTIKGKERRDDQLSNQKAPAARRSGLSESSKRSKRGSSPNGGARNASSKRTKLADADAYEDPQRPRQVTHVSADTITPLQRMLDKQGSSSGPSRSSDVGAKTKARRSGRAHMSQAEKDEEDEIAWLEAMLGGGGNAQQSKSGSGSKGEGELQDEDGFDDFIGDLDRFYPGMYDSDGSAATSDQEEDAMEFSGEESSLGEDETADDRSDSDMESLSTEDESASDSENQSLSELSEPQFDELGNEVRAGPSTATSPSTTTLAPTSGGEADGSAASGRYIPPAARAEAALASARGDAAEEEHRAKLRRQLKGLLNRLGDANLDAIVTSIDDVYRNNARASVSQTLTRLIIDTIAVRSNVMLTDTFVVVHAALVAALYRVVGLEFAAGFVQEVADDILKHHATLRSKATADMAAVEGEGDEGEGTGKELSNLMSLAAHLYNLQVIACPLIYDFIRLLLGNEQTSSPVSEADVDTLLRVIKTCGQQLRHDDPSSLRQIASLAKERTSVQHGSSDHQSDQASAAAPSSRMRFMLETLDNLNKTAAKSVRKQKESDRSTSEAMVTSMRRYLSGMDKKRTLRSYGQPMRVVLKDLEEAETRGKWWLIGAAWKGQRDQAADDAGIGDEDPSSVHGVTAMSNAPSKRPRANDGGIDGDSANADLFALARQQGMNTDSRRLIFVTLLDPGNDSYSAAAQRLLTLSLSDLQRREVVRVILHCLGREQVYNPYYCLVGWKLGCDDTSTRITMQFALWDYLREIGEKSVGGRSVVRDAESDGQDAEFDDPDESRDAASTSTTRLWHMSRCYGWWIAKGALSLSVLRTIDFASLRSAKAINFLRLLFLHMLLSCQTQNPLLRFKSHVGDSDAAVQRQHQVAIERLFLRGTKGLADLTRGLHFFFATQLKEGDVQELIGVDGARNGSANTHGGTSALESRASWACTLAEGILSKAATSAAAVSDDDL